MELVCRLMFDFAARVQDIAYLEHKNIIEHDNLIRVHLKKLKTGARTVQMSKKTFELYNKYKSLPNREESPYVFTLNGEALKSNTICKRLKRFAIAAGVPNL
jgi:site-specific recombinase XerD